MKLNKKQLIASLTFLSLSGTQAYASGYSNGLSSTSGLANSYAGSATGIHDVSDMFFNPAILTNVKDGEFVLAVSYKDFTANPQGASTYTGSTRGYEVNDAGESVVLPALYVAKHLSENAVLGLAITSPFGLHNKYGDNWQGKDRANEVEADSINFNPTLAYKFSDKFSFGAGLQIQYFQASTTSMTAIGGDNYTPNKMHVSDWGYGYNLGATYQATDKLKFGAGYRSQVDHKLTGTIQILGRSSSDIQAIVNTPASFTAGTAYKLKPNLELAYDVTWTNWSRINEISATAYQNSTLNAALKSPRAINYKNSIMHSLGANFQLNQKWLLRTGLAYEKDTQTSIRVPTADNIWTSIGFNYKVSKTFSVDAAYVHQFYRKASVNLNQTSSASSFTAHYKLSTDVFSLGVRKEF